MINKNGAIKELNKTIREISLSRSGGSSLQQTLEKEYKYPREILNPYLKGIKSPEELSIKELFWIADSINKSKVGNIKLKDYFTTNEIILYQQKHYIEPTKESIYPIKIPVQKIGAEHWMAVIPVGTLINWYRNQVLRYNPESQRQLKVTRDGNLTIDLRPRAVQAIRNQLLEHTYIPDELALNMNINDDDLSYSEYEGAIKLESGMFDVIDGWHRLTSIIQASNADPNWGYDNFPIHIMAYDTADANRYIVQKSKMNPINKNFIAAIDRENPVNIIVDKINTAYGSYLKGKFDNNSTWIDVPYFISCLRKRIDYRDDRAEYLKLANQLISIFNSFVLDGVESFSKADSVALTYTLSKYARTEEILDAYQRIIQEKDSWLTPRSNEVRKMFKCIDQLEGM